jgi:hypothetical protein
MRVCVWVHAGGVSSASMDGGADRGEDGEEDAGPSSSSLIEELVLLGFHPGDAERAAAAGGGWVVWGGVGGAEVSQMAYRRIPLYLALNPKS